MSDEVTIALKAEGMEEVANALKGVRDTIISSEKDSTRAVLEGARSRINALRQEGREKEKLAKQIAKAENDLNKTFGTQNNGARSAMVGSNTSNLSGGGGGLGGILSSLTGASGSLSSLAGKAGVAGAAFAGVKAGVDMAIEGLKMFGNFLINDVIKPGLEIQTLAQQVANNSRGAISPQEAEQKARAIGTRYNVDPKTILESIAGFGETTGNYDLAAKTAELLAQVQKAYGGKVEDYGNLASNLYRPGMEFTDLQNLMLTQIGQGQVEGGKYTIKQIAGLGGKINEPASHIAGGVDVATSSATALIQQTGRTVGSVDEAATATRGFVGEIAANKGGKFSKLLTSEGQVTDVREALIQSLIATKGGQSRYLKQAGFTSEESGKVLAGYTEEYLKAMKDLPNTTDNQRKAAEAATESFERIRNATASAAQVQDDANKTLKTPGEQLASVLNNLKDKLAAEVMPQMEKFTTDIVKMAPDLIKASLVLAKAFILLAQTLPYVIDALKFLADPLGLTNLFSSDNGTSKPGGGGQGGASGSSGTEGAGGGGQGGAGSGSNVLDGNEEIFDTPDTSTNFTPSAPSTALATVINTNNSGTSSNKSTEDKAEADKKAAVEAANLTVKLQVLQAELDATVASFGDFNRAKPLKRD